MAKSLQEQIEEKEEEIRKLKEEKDKLVAANQPQYPKHIQVPVAVTTSTAPTQTVIVNSEEEEKAAKSGKAVGEPLAVTAEQKLIAEEQRRKADEDVRLYEPHKEVQPVANRKARPYNPADKGAKRAPRSTPRATRSKK